MCVIEMLAGSLFFTLVLLAYAFTYNAPLIVLVVLARRRLGTLAPRLLLAAGFLAPRICCGRVRSTARCSPALGGFWVR